MLINNNLYSPKQNYRQKNTKQKPAFAAIPTKEFNEAYNRVLKTPLKEFEKLFKKYFKEEYSEFGMRPESAETTMKEIKGTVNELKKDCYKGKLDCYCGPATDMYEKGRGMSGLNPLPSNIARARIFVKKDDPNMSLLNSINGGDKLLNVGEDIKFPYGNNKGDLSYEESSKKVQEHKDLAFFLALRNLCREHRIGTFEDLMDDL